MVWVKVAGIHDITPGKGKTVTAGGRELAVFNADGKFFVIDNTCAHRGGPLGEGELEGTVVTCPWHGWQYDVTTGKNNMGSAVAAYKTKVEGGNVMADV